MAINRYLHDLAGRCFSTFIMMLKIMVPVMFAVRLAEQFGLIETLSPYAQPVMGLLNLPPEAAVVCLTSVFVGLYGAIAALPVLVGLEMTAAQFTGLCMFMLFAHALPVEQAIIRKAGGSYWHSAAVRLLAGGFSSFMVGWLSRATGYLDHPQSLDHLAQMGGRDSTFGEWLVASATGLAVLFLILTALLMLLDILTKLRITLVIGWLLSPVLRLSGLDRSVATITTAGVLLGVGFGGGLIIAERDNPEISEAARKRALLWIALCHGMIEDVGLLAAVGGNALVMIIGRVGLTLAIFGIWTAGQHLLASRAGYSPPD